LMLACYTAAFDGPRDCLAEQMLRREGGPVAVIGGSRVTMPYAMAVMAEGMLDGMFHKRRETLGEVMLDARAALLTEQAAGGNRQLLDAVAKAISPRPDELAAERAEHVLLFHLLGDPLLRIPRGEPLRVSCPRTGTAGEPLEVAVEGNVTGGYLVELVCRRDRFRHPPGNRRELDTSHDGLAALTDVYAKANQRAWTTVAGAAENGSFSVTLPVPSEAAGPCHVRVVVEGDDQLALGAADVYVRQPRPEPAAQSTNAAGVDAASKE